MTVSIADGNKQRGMTLIEIMLTTVISVMIIGSALGVILSIGKSQLSLSNYCSMNQQSRQALEVIGRDIKLFDPSGLSITTDGKTLTGSIPDPSGTGTIAVKYNYNPTKRILTRKLDDSSSEETILFRDIESFSLTGINKAGNTITNLSADATSIKQLQLDIKLATKVLASNTRQPVISAQYTIRK